MTAIPVFVRDDWGPMLPDPEQRTLNAAATRDADPTAFFTEAIRTCCSLALLALDDDHPDRILFEAVWRTAHPNITDLIPQDEDD